MKTPCKQYVLNKYLPAKGGRIEMTVIAKNADDYSIDNVCFLTLHKGVELIEDISLFTLALRVYGYEFIDTWIDELLPAQLRADTFLEDADKAYEEAYK